MMAVSLQVMVGQYPARDALARRTLPGRSRDLCRAESPKDNRLSPGSRKVATIAVPNCFTSETRDRLGSMQLKPPYTSRQGQFLAFIHHYTTLHGRPPAEAELVQFFQVTPPSVHQMILTLERRGLITRAPGEARSIKLKLPPEKLPPLRGIAATTTVQPPSRQPDGQQSTDHGAALLRLGKVQLDDLFAHN